MLFLMPTNSVTVKAMKATNYTVIKHTESKISALKLILCY